MPSGKSEKASGSSSRSGSRRQSPEASSGKTASPIPSPSPSALVLDDVILMMHQIVLREAAESRGRVTPIGRETARAILRIQGAAKGARGIAKDAAADAALRYLFRDVAAKLAAVWHKIVADATPEKSVLWERRAQFAELEEIYAALGISDFSDPLELKLKDIGAVYDSFRRQAIHEDHYDIVDEEVGTAIDDIARGPLAEIQEAISLFPTALKARILRAMRLREFKDELATFRNIGSNILYELAPREVPNPAERAVRAIAKSAQDREDAALNIADFAEKVFGAAIAGGAKGNKKK